MNAANTLDSGLISRKAIQYPGLSSLFLVASLMGVLSYTRYYIFAPVAETQGHYWPGVVFWMACFYPWAILARFVFRLERDFPVAAGIWPRNAAILAACGVAISYIAFQMSVLIGIALKLLFQSPITIQKPFWAIPLNEFWSHWLLYLGVVSMTYVVRKLIESQENERRNAALALEKSQLEASLRNVELDVLRMRLNPHFLFNTLQNIAVLTQYEPRTATQMLVRLGDLLRASFRGDAQAEVSLAAEIALTRSYLEVEKMRFQDRLSIRVDVAEGTEQALVPTLLLQPLVENAIKHGLRGINSSGTIVISSRKLDQSLILTVADNGVGLPAASEKKLELGVGLGATSERLALLYPGKHKFLVEAGPVGGTQVTISFPFRTDIPFTPEKISPHEQTSHAHC